MDANVVELRQALLNHAAADRLLSRIEDGGLLAYLVWEGRTRSPFVAFEFWKEPFTQDGIDAAMDLRCLLQSDARARAAFQDYAWSVGAVLEPASFAPEPKGDDDA